jgi:hypothetical protein
MGVARAKAAVASNSNDLESIVNVVVFFGVGGESMRVCKSRSRSNYEIAGELRGKGDD